MTSSSFTKLQLESNYLEDYRTGLRSKTLPWDSFSRTGLLTSEQARQLVELNQLLLQARSTTDNKKILAGEVFKIDSYVSIFVDLLTTRRDEERMDVRKYILVILIDLFNSNDEILQSFVANSSFTEVIQGLVGDLQANDEVLKMLTLYELVYFAIQPVAQPKVQSSVIVNLFESISGLLSSSKFNLQALSLEYLVALIAVKQYRTQYLALSEKTDYIRPLFDNLNVSPTSIGSTEQIQFQYRTLLVILLLTYTIVQDPAQLRQFNHRYALYYGKLITLVKISIKEKIIRLVIAIFQNLTSAYATSTVSKNIVKQLILIEGFHPILNNLKQRKWTDDELIADLESLSLTFDDVARDLTSFDEYHQELKTKQFRNSPVHSNDTFFVANLHRFQDSKYALFKELLSLLSDDEIKHSPSSLVLILGDISKILKLDDRAVEIVNSEGRKLDIMNFLSERDSSVRFAALSVTQILVSKSLK